MASPLAGRKCKPCEGGIQPLPIAAAKKLLEDVPGWELVDAKAIRKTFKCKDFLDAVRLIQAIAPIAEAEDHQDRAHDAHDQ